MKLTFSMRSVRPLTKAELLATIPRPFTPDNPPALSPLPSKEQSNFELRRYHDGSMPSGFWEDLRLAGKIPNDVRPVRK
jgi:hypothetical protein